MMTIYRLIDTGKFYRRKGRVLLAVEQKCRQDYPEVDWKLTKEESDHGFYITVWNGSGDVLRRHYAQKETVE